jgi:DNA-binding transcriptional regulator YiaG
LRWADEARFWTKVDVRRPKECWPWRAGLNDGYGLFYVPGRGMVHAHRVAHFIATGTWAPAHVAHTCDYRRCCNPNHLFAASAAENNEDMRRKGRARGNRSAGERNPNAKLSDEEVATIRELYAAGGVSQDALATRYGVSQSAISRAIR